MNRFRTVPRLAERGSVSVLRRAVGGEVALAAGIFGLTGIMAGLAPPTLAPDRGPDRPAGLVVSGSDFGTTVRARLRVIPGTAGPNRFELRLSDFDTGEPADARAVRLTFRLPERSDVGATELILDRDGPGTWESRGVNLSVEGTWVVAVLVETESGSVTIPLEVRTRLPEQEITVSEAPGQPTLYTISLQDGLSVQGYADPGEPGSNEIHFTFFSAEGGEQPVDDARITAALDDEAPQDLEIRELTPGHFVASIDLETGRWIFRVEAVSPEGTRLNAYFQQRIGEET